MMLLATWISGTPGNCISGPGAGSACTTSAVLPIAMSAYAIASDDPIESPSGLVCEEITNRCRARMASAICWTSGLVVIVSIAGIAVRLRRGLRGVELVQQLLDPILAADRFIEDELERRDAPQAQPRSDLAAKKRRGTIECARRLAPRLLVAERRVEHARVLQIRGHLNACDRHKAQARIVNVAREQLTDFATNLIGNAIGTGTLGH